MTELHWYEVEVDEAAEDELFNHSLSDTDPYDVVETGRYKVFANPPHNDRMKVIGYHPDGRLLTVIMTRPTDNSRSVKVITGWLADLEETARYSQPGGTIHA